MVATNIKQLENALKKHVRKALNVVSNKAEAIMYEETYGFYTAKTQPKQYIRTCALGDTPRTTSMTSQGNEIYFSAYLDQTHQYTTGKNPMMSEVLDVANDHYYSSVYGLRSPVGRQHFWDRAEKKIGKTLDQTMRRFFRK